MKIKIQQFREEEKVILMSIPKKKFRNDKEDRQIFCTYARYQRLGWILGWFLVGMGTEPQLNGYANDFNNQGCRLLLMEFNDSKPVPQWFWFIPRRGIIRFLFKG